MKLFYIEKISLKQEKLRNFKFLNFTLIKYRTNGREYNIEYFPKTKEIINKDVPFFYLKVNSYSEYTIKALQHWIDIINYMNGDFIIICDKDRLKKFILKEVKFYNENIKFIKSIKKPLRKIVKEIITGFWAKAAHAHLTTFFHAQKYKIQEFWNVDADDTIIAASPKEVACLLKKVEQYAIDNDISLFSYDMWRSRTRAKAWTFGVTYTRNNSQLVELFKKADRKWQKDYINCDQALNIDWFCTYLKNNNLAKIETFYFENCYFLHMGDFIFDPVGKFISCFKSNKVIFPLLCNLYNNYKMGEIPVSNDCIKIDTLKDVKDSLNFIQTLFVYNKNDYPEKLKRLWEIE